MTTDREALLAEMFPEPIAVYVDELRNSDDVPVVAIGACLARYQDAGPLLRQVLTRAAREAISADSEANQLFRTLHIVGGARDSLAFPTLLRFLQGEAERVEWLLGDAATETLPNIVIGVFDGNTGALFDAILNKEADGAVRGALLGASTFLTWEGRIDRADMTAFLERFATTEATPDDALVWFDWSEAIALLGLRHLEPLVSQAESDDRLEEDLFDRDNFEEMLARSEQAPDDRSRFDERFLGYIDDVLAALQLFPNSEEDSVWDFDEEPGEEPGDWAPSDPVINPFRHVGRNDPCPCGSGKKAKRCCLAA